jgi:hypothetical protein
MQLCLFSQRWRERRESYRPAGEPINPRLYEVAELAGDREAKAFIWRTITRFPIRARVSVSGCSREGVWSASPSSATHVTTGFSPPCFL